MNFRSLFDDASKNDTYGLDENCPENLKNVSMKPLYPFWFFYMGKELQGVWNLVMYNGCEMGNGTLKGLEVLYDENSVYSRGDFEFPTPFPSRSPTIPGATLKPTDVTNSPTQSRTPLPSRAPQHSSQDSLTGFPSQQPSAPISSFSPSSPPVNALPPTDIISLKPSESVPTPLPSGSPTIITSSPSQREISVGPIIEDPTTGVFASLGIVLFIILILAACCVSFLICFCVYRLCFRGRKKKSKVRQDATVEMPLKIVGSGEGAPLVVRTPGNE